MSLSPQEMESKAQMLVNEPGYVIPPDIQGIPRARIEGRSTVINNQNAAIARLNPAPAVAPAVAPETQETQSMSRGGKRRSKRRKSKRKRKTRR